MSMCLVTNKTMAAPAAIENQISINLYDVNILLNAIATINNDNMSNHNYSRTDVQKQTTYNLLQRSTEALNYANAFGYAIQKMNSGDYSEDVLIACYDSLIKLDDYIKHKEITYNNTLLNEALNAIQKFIPLVNYIADNYANLLEQNNLPVYSSDMYSSNNTYNNTNQNNVFSFLSNIFH